MGDEIFGNRKTHLEYKVSQEKKNNLLLTHTEYEEEKERSKGEEFF